MATTIFSHYDVDFEAGLPTKLPTADTAAWGDNALQTVTIARHFPRDPQQAIGHRGVVDFTSGQRTTDLTLDCILTEQTAEAVDGTGASGTSIYKHAERSLAVGQESYVLTSCNVGFTAGAPATVGYGYLTSGAGSALEKLSSAPGVLTDGEEAYYAVVMGDDGSGVVLISKLNGSWVTANGQELVLPSGVQSLRFSSTINKDRIMDIRSAQPVQFITTYPIDITADIETMDKSGTTWQAGNLTAIGVRLNNVDNHADRTGYSATPSSTYPGDRTNTNFAASDKDLVLASGLTKIEETETLNVGGHLTYTYNYNVADLAIPLSYS